MSKGSSGVSTTSAPPAIPALTAIQPASRPISSMTITRLWLSAVVWIRSIASVAMCTAVSKPIDRSVPATSLSMVLGMATIRTPVSATFDAACRVPSPPMQISASIRSASSVARTASRPPSAVCGWYRAVPSRVPPVSRTPRMSLRVSGCTSPSATPFQPLRKPMMVWPYSPRPCLTTARIAALRPGQSPPPVSRPMRTKDSRGLGKEALGGARGPCSSLSGGPRDLWPGSRRPGRPGGQDGGMARTGFWDVDGGAAARATGRWWSENAEDYLSEHGGFLGDADFRWCPEGLREEEAGLLGDVAGQRVLEVGAGAAQCSRWLAGRGASVLATDIAPGMVAQSAELDRRTGRRVPAVVADARALPVSDESFDTVFTSFGAIAFVPDAARLHAEVARVLRPGGRWVFAVVHPARWMFPDDPTSHGMRVLRSYFDRTPYVEVDDAGAPLYAEYHRTVGDHVRELASAGLVIDDLVEPEWTEGNLQVGGGWGPHRGRYVPGTAIFVTHRPG